MKTFTKQLLQILVLIAAMLACVLNLQAQNMSRYITMTVQNGQQIHFGMQAEAAGTLVRVINGANDTTITVGTDWTFPTNYTAASDTIKVYGDITWFSCSDNSTNLTTLDVSNNTALTALYCSDNQLTAIDVSNNTALTRLICGGNQLTTLDVTNNTALTVLRCYGNQLDDCALDQMFRTLPERQASDNAKVFIKNRTATNPGVDGCQTPIAKAKNWKVMDNIIEINNTTFTCQEVNIDNILTAHVIKLYPNPVNSELYIATDAEVRMIQVFNMNGVEVARKFESNRIDLNHLQPNTYIVRITTDRNSSNQFVVKQ